MNLSNVPINTPATLMFHDGSINIVNDRPDVYEINPERTAAQAKAIPPDEWVRLKANEQFMARFRLVFPDIALPDHPLQMHGSGVQHVVGLIVLTDMALNAGKKPFWRYPEAQLHPKAQLGLGDLLAFYITRMEGQQ